MYEGSKVYGPYEGKDGRLRVSIDNNTISYPKYLVECYIGRYLTVDETVDHIDCNPLNNEISNLQVLNRSEHASLDAKRLKKRNFVCPTCEETFELIGTRLSNALTNSRKGKTGPFCSRSCAGKYGKKVQMGEIDKIKHTILQPEYTTSKK